MKKVIIISILVFLGIVALAVFLGSCSICPREKDVMNGRAVEKHYRKNPFHSYRATYRKDGPFWVIHYENMKEQFDEATFCKPPFKSGSWVTK